MDITESELRIFDLSINSRYSPVNSRYSPVNSLILASQFTILYGRVSRIDGSNIAN